MYIYLSEIQSDIVTFLSKVPAFAEVPVTAESAALPARLHKPGNGLHIIVLQPEPFERANSPWIMWAVKVTVRVIQSASATGPLTASDAAETVAREIHLLELPSLFENSGDRFMFMRHVNPWRTHRYPRKHQRFTMIDTFYEIWAIEHELVHLIPDPYPPSPWPAGS